MRWPAVSADGRVIVFEHDFGIWKLDLASKKATAIPLNIAAETQENLTEVETFNSKSDDFDLAALVRGVAFSIHARFFPAPVEEVTKALTDGPSATVCRYSPYGSLSFYLRKSAREEVYLHLGWHGAERQIPILHS